MKTPIQELIEQMWEIAKYGDSYEVAPCIEAAESMLEKEKEVITDAWMDDRFPLDKEWVKQCAEQYYNETFNTNDVK